jgi:hypothetical protein
MRRVAVTMLLVVLLGVLWAPAQAQPFLTFNQGVYEFESYISNIVYNGTWSSTKSYSATVRSTSSASAWLQFQAVGKVLVITRFMRPTGSASSMNVCLGIPTVCTLVSNTSVHPDGYFDTYTVNLASGSNVVTIEWVSGGIFLDKFMILGDPNLYLTSIVPTATAVNTATPAFTATAGPSPTPAPSSTPAPTATPISLVWALDPAKSYSDINGQIVSTEYTASAADVFLGILLMALFFSVWGMFIFALFVLIRYKKPK